MCVLKLLESLKVREANVFLSILQKSVNPTITRMYAPEPILRSIMNTTSLIDTAALLLGPGHPRSISASLWACLAETLGVERV